jgi:hypothetical protein
MEAHPTHEHESRVVAVTCAECTFSKKKMELAKKNYNVTTREQNIIFTHLKHLLPAIIQL